MLLGSFAIACSSPDVSRYPSEPCENIDLSNLPIIMRGFAPENYNSVSIETYRKNSKFDSLISVFYLNIDKPNKMRKNERMLRLPAEITTGYDWNIVFNDSLSYKLTEMTTEWEPRWCESFCGYACTLNSYKLDGELDDRASNIHLEAPAYKN